MAAVGDSAGGNLVAALTLLAKEHGGVRRHRRTRHRDRARGPRRPAHGRQRLPLRVREANPSANATTVRRCGTRPRPR